MSTDKSSTTRSLVRIDNKTVQGLGYKVHVPDIHRVLYHQGDRTATIEIEGGTGDSGEVVWAVYLQTLEWDGPETKSETGNIELETILSRVSASLDLLKMPHLITR